MLLGGGIYEAELKMFAMGQTYEPMVEMKNYVHYYTENNSLEGFK
jgi:hypothetical protein